MTYLEAKDYTYKYIKLMKNVRYFGKIALCTLIIF